MKGASQNARILKYLQQGKKINPLLALNKFGCFRLARVMNDLKNAGINWNGRMVGPKGKQYKEYWI